MTQDGKAPECKHMLHLIPRWQSSARHERLKAVMSDRPDLIQSELAVCRVSPKCVLRAYIYIVNIEGASHDHRRRDA